MRRLIWLLCIALSVGAAPPKSLIGLGDKDFEHRTQAATGQTAGVWFCYFYAPWCEHCRSLAPIWEEVAKRLDGQIAVAAIDTTTSPQLMKRFEQFITQFPTIMLFRDQKMYVFTGEENAETMVKFARSGYKTTPAHKVPGELPFWQRLASGLVSSFANNPKVLLIASVTSIIALVGSALYETYTDRKKLRAREERISAAREAAAAARALAGDAAQPVKKDE